ncbi:four helix bundle protein [Xylanibacter ruminicola]|uniref:Four helix bundle protein n=1 Tax=Xylanibacter ruminicola TaxID=839 RepID=A0A1M7DPU2_XYLRU|nr:four helix bundle protein [Xylanibacter ruminicola]SHL81524.1 four helix bundle protein [Xylanibacter ruminicola]
MKEIVIANLSLNFALRIVKLYNYLCDDKQEYVMSKQLLRSGTSIGANIAESEHAQSKADFVSKLYISLKEANETKYWLTLLYKASYLSDNEYESIMQDLRIIIGTLVNSIKRVKDNPKE